MNTTKTEEDTTSHPDWHNPENVPEAKIPPGYRFMTKAEVEFARNSPSPDEVPHNRCVWQYDEWSDPIYYGALPAYTFITPSTCQP